MNLEKEIYGIIDEIQILQKVSVEHTDRITELEKQAAGQSNGDRRDSDERMIAEAAKVYLDNCNTVSIEPDEFEKQLKKLISNLLKAVASGNKRQIELEILTINKILKIYRQ